MAESLRAFAKRASDAIAVAEGLATEHDGILIVSHRLLIGGVAALQNRLCEPDEIFDYARRFRIPPAALYSPATGIIPDKPVP